MKNAEKTAILRLKKNDDLYRHLGDDNYKNLRTDVDWKIEDEKASQIFIIDYNATMLFNKYPMLEKLVNKLNLKKINND